MIKSSQFIAIGLWISSCSPDPMFEVVSTSGINFENSITTSEELNILNYEYFYNGAGVGVGDFDQDGLQDLFFAGNQVSSRLYLNQGNLSFKDVTEEWGCTTQAWITGVSVVDINADSYPDVYLSVAGSQDSLKRQNLLFLNRDGRGFEESAKSLGLDYSDYTTHTYFFDYDRDGDLDAFLLNHFTNDRDHSVITSPINNGQSPSNDRLLRNDNGHFKDVSSSAGIQYEGYGLGTGLLDVNGDGWLDIYVANDYLFNDVLYVNNQDGTFTNQLSRYFTSTSHFSMGLDVGDVNNDGRSDLLVADMLPAEPGRQKMLSGPMNYYKYDLSLRLGYTPQFMRNTLQVARPDFQFDELAFAAGVAKTDWSWSVLLEDFDLDGFDDLFMSNGYPKNITDRDFAAYAFAQRGGRYVKGSKQNNLIAALDTLDSSPLLNFFFQNTGSESFLDQTVNWVSEDIPGFSHGAAVADLDNDGDLDLVVNNMSGGSVLYQNMQAKPKYGHSLVLSLTGGSANTLAEGAIVDIYYPDGVQKRKMRVSPRGYMSSSTHRIHISFMGHETIDLDITWPDGRCSFHPKVEPNGDYRLFQDSIAQWLKPRAQVTGNDPLNIHPGVEENDFVDFDFQPNLPIRLSRNGPAMAAGNLMDDSTDELIIGAPKGKPTLIYDFKNPNQSISIPGSVNYEDQGILILDVNNDEANDVLIASGGYEDFPGSIYTQDRLYLNINGALTYQPNALPVRLETTSVLRAGDVDNDGDLDVFVGGDFYPKKYPLSSTSRLLINNAGVFTDATDVWFPDGAMNQNVKTALFTDIDRDGDIDLLVAGFFSAIRVFRNESGFFKLMDLAIPNQLRGRWLSLAGTDADLDNDLDYVVGNWGLNVSNQVSVKSPGITYVKDFDSNGTVDFIETYEEAGIRYPAAQRDMLLRQLPHLRKDFPDYRSYANASFPDLDLNLDGAYRFVLTELRSVLLRNDGTGKFEVEPLSAPAQNGPVSSTLVMDIDQDGWDDLLINGGWQSTEVIHGPQSGLTAHWLINERGKFRFGGYLANTTFSSVKAQVIVRGETGIQVLASANGHPVHRLVSLVSGHRLTSALSGNGTIQYSVNGRNSFKEYYYGAHHLGQSSVGRILLSSRQFTQEVSSPDSK